MLELYREVSHLAMAAGLLDWDQQCYMPPGGAALRAEQLATLAKLAHERLTSPEMGQLLDELEPWAASLDPDSFEASVVRVARREYDRATRIPAELEAEFSRAASAGFAAWAEARQAGDFRIFAPKLERLVQLTIERAEALGYEERRYDALLNLFEPGSRTSQVQALFQQLKEGLVPLVHAVAERVDRVKNDFLFGGYDERKQWDFGVRLLKAIGFDFQRGRQDRSEHPFTVGFGSGDVRLTTRFQPYLGSALFGTLHEGGHGLYEQGIPPEFAGTPVGSAASFGVHESQSRLWENLVGRSRAFWRHFYPELQALFPERLGEVDLDTFYAAINRVEPSLIRVEADELTYNLHIFLRFDLELKLIEGDLKVADLPEAWRAGMRELLGRAPENDRDGVMQDVHWSQGAFGYFPSYTLGNVLSVQLFEKAKEERPDIPQEIERGEFAGLLGWMRERIHRHGGKFTGTELIVRATGREADAAPYLRYLREKYEEIYGL
ncbi:MAG: carboxypeptidase M32 [Firmicutes bacterium]|nr:carboxypeptidase M32 [Bacillota bacterium]